MHYKLLKYNQLQLIPEVEVAINEYLKVSENCKVVVDRHGYVQLLTADNTVVEVIQLSELLAIFTQDTSDTIEMWCRIQLRLNVTASPLLAIEVKSIMDIRKAIVNVCTKQFGLVLDYTIDFSGNVTVTTETGIYLVRLSTIIADTTTDNDVISGLLNMHREYVAAQFDSNIQLLDCIDNAISKVACKDTYKGFITYRYMGDCMVEIITMDIRTSVKLGKFLKSCTDLSDYNIQQYVENQKALDSNIEAYTVKYINTAEEYVAMYKVPLNTRGNDNASCMTGSKSVVVYEHDNNLKLFLVYLDNTLVARTLVRTDNNTYVKIYLNEGSISEFQVKRLLHIEGFTSSAGLSGITLSKVVNIEGNLVCPFIDGNTASITDCGTHLLIDVNGTANYIGSSTSGVANPHNI